MNFLKKNKTVLNILWACLMATCCGANVYMLLLEWNAFALIGLVLCGISFIMSIAELILEKNQK